MTTAVSEKKPIVFSHPEKVTQILREASRLRSQILIRWPQGQKAARGIMESCDGVKRIITIGGISNEGHKYLEGHPVLNIELVLFATKVTFDCNVFEKDNQQLVLGFPQKIFFLERRGQTRFVLPDDMAGLALFPELKFDTRDGVSPFVPVSVFDERPLYHRSLSLLVVDMSLEGMACLTRFSSLAKPFKPMENHLISLQFPSLGTWDVEAQIRWCRKTSVPLGEDLKNNLADLLPLVNKSVKLEDLRDNHFRFGFQFTQVNPEIRKQIMGFLRMVQSHGSV